MFENDNNFLARWLSNELTEEERTEFEQSDVYDDYQKLIELTTDLEVPTGSEDAVLAKRIIDSVIYKGHKKVVNFRKVITYAIAASVALLISLGVFFNEVTYETGVGEKTTVLLPDETEVKLNANTKLTRKRYFWSQGKQVTLIGEAFFSVTKGKNFKVVTSDGEVNVLGTEFNILSRSKDIAIDCYEGKIAYRGFSSDKTAYLEQGDGIRIIKNSMAVYEHADQFPRWQKGESVFENATLQEVISELQNQYDISIVVPSKPGSEQHFSGVFVHNNLEKALRTVFVPMGFDYELDEGKKMVVLK